MQSTDTSAPVHGLFGHPPGRLVDPPTQTLQFSPLVPGAAALETADGGSLRSMTMRAAAGTLERRHDLAAMLRALAPGAFFTVLAPKDMGGARLARDLSDLGCTVEESAKAHHRICRGVRPDSLDEDLISPAIAAGAPRKLDAHGLWSQPGIFSWDRVDPGTALLIESLPALAGRGADLGCGIGLLAHAVLATPAVKHLDLIDIDRRAIEAARRNVDDTRVRWRWADVTVGTGLADLDFVVMNPPFHAGGEEDKNLGQIFIRQAAAALHRGGRLWLVANRHLPYEACLKPLFRHVTPHLDAHGFKVIEATK
jgi:16S rRNA (guanine1207-N2)-methyltransferase